MKPLHQRRLSVDNSFLTTKLKGREIIVESDYYNQDERMHLPTPETIAKQTIEMEFREFLRKLN